MPDPPKHNWKAIVSERIAALSLSGAAESDLAEELAQHLEDCYGEYQSAGDGEDEAYRKTIAELDNTHPLADAVQTPAYMAPKETAQNGVVVERAPQRISEFLPRVGTRIRRLCATQDT